MEDSQIIELYWQRKESAIAECRSKYGAYCYSIADHILHSEQDAEECVNDTWLRVWRSIPPRRPNRLSVFLGRIVRNLAIDRYRREHTQKYGGGQLAACLEELSECIGEEAPVEDRLVLKELLDSFLRTLPDRNREIFMHRYWYMAPVGEIARRYRMTQGAVKMNLSRTREKLRAYLEKEGIGV